MHALLLSFALCAADPTTEELTAAYRDHDGLQYTGTYVRALTLARTSWIARGEVTVSEEGAVHIAGQWTRPGEEPVRAEWHEDANGWTLLLPDEGTYAQGTDPRAAGDDGFWFSQLALANFDADPYGDGSAVQLGSEIRFEGGVCRIVHATRGRYEKTDWYVAVADWMPRLAERYSKHSESETLVERLTVAKLRRGDAVVERPRIEGLERRETTESAALDEPAPEAGQQEVTDLAEGLEPLRAHFESQVGRPRLIGLFAPS